VSAHSSGTAREIPRHPIRAVAVFVIVFAIQFFRHI
jgi:hypothetical protein